MNNDPQLVVRLHFLGWDLNRDSFWWEYKPDKKKVLFRITDEVLSDSENVLDPFYLAYRQMNFPEHLIVAIMKYLSGKGDFIPVRVQRKRTKDWKMPDNTVYVGRPTRWGNPFRVGVLFDNLYPVTQEQAVGFFRKRILEYGVQTHYIDDAIRELKGKNLACWCPLNQPCHADILLKIANV